jgi:sacsin
VQLGMPIVHLPDVVFNALLRDASEVKQKVVTPDTARHFLRECKTLVSLGKSYKLVLLEYWVCLAKNKTIQCSGLLVLKLVKVMM